MHIILTLTIITLSALLTSCGKNVMNGDFFIQEQSNNLSTQPLQGYWKSAIFEIDTEGEIDQNIFLQDNLQITSSSRQQFDQQLTNYDCSAVKELTEVKKIAVELHLFMHYEQYYMIANIYYTTTSNQILRCPGVLGQGNYISDRKDYLFFEDIDLGVHFSKQSSGNTVLRFLR